MKNFWKDYVDLCKMTGAFYKKHWKGVVLLNASIYGAGYAYLFKDSIKDKMKKKVQKENEAQ